MSATSVGVGVALAVIGLTGLPSYATLARSHDASPAVPVTAQVRVGNAAATAEPREPARAATHAVAGLSGEEWSDTARGTIDRNVFELALGAARCVVRSGVVSTPSTLTVIDYSKPSTADRLWVYDLRSHELVYHELVAHGKGSGENYATIFSNQPETHRSSIGLFVTADTYVGSTGYSLRLDGLDVGFNDRARERAIVMHGAPYVNESLARTQGRLGRSWGCPALREAVARDVIDTIRDGNLVFSYYPDPNWLNSSKFLGDCAAAD